MNTDQKKTLKKLNYKTEWDLSQLYTSFDEIDRHVEKIERAYKKFEKKYRNSDTWLATQGGLLKALEEYESLLKLNPGRPVRYLSMARDINSFDEKIEAKLNQVSERMTHISNRLLFLPLAIGSLSASKKKEYARGKVLKPFHYFLEKIFEESKYQLTEKEERVISLLGMPAYALWVQGVNKEESQLTVPFKGKEIPLSEAIYKVHDLPTVQRRKLWKDSMEALSDITRFATHEINAVVTTKKIEDELRGFEKPYSATVLEYENDIESIENLVETVSKQFSISREFYTLKKELLGLDKMYYADRNAGIGTIRTTFSFDSQVEILREALGGVGEEYQMFFEAMLEEGRVDVKPKKGKKGGAYCACGSSSIPVYVFLNDVGTFSSFRTLAHEMGHALHGELTKQHTRTIYQSFPISMAEVASTFFENIAFDQVFETLSDKEKVIALHDKLNSSISTIFRQIALFNFEVELHGTVRKDGAMPQEAIIAKLNEHMSNYLGDDMILQESDGNFFASWSHIRYFFYAYAYAYGELISTALYKKYKEDPEYKEKIRTLFASGGSMTPKDLLRKAGIDLTPEFFKEGLKEINKEINTLKRLAKKAGMIK